MIKTGLIGFGVGGQTFHAPLIDAVDGLELSVIRATRPEQQAVAREKYPKARIVTTSEEVIGDPGVQLVVVSTPNTSHYTLGSAALAAGKHLVMDKPFTVTSADADKLIAEAAAARRVLTVYHNRRFDGDYRTLQKILEGSLLGRVVEFENRYDRFRNYLKKNAWREEDLPGSGILYDLGSHLIDQATSLFGLPEAVTADIRAQREGSKTDDNFELIFHYPRLKVTLKAGMLVKETIPRFILLGVNGSYVKYGMDVQEAALKAGRTFLTQSDWGVESPENWGMLNTEKEGLSLDGRMETERGDYFDFYRNVRDAILGRAEPIITPVQARNTIRLIEIALQSARERRTVDCQY